MKIYDDLDKLIGSTPMLRLKKTEAAEGTLASVTAKLEYFNPAGSAKDRVALHMINDAEARGIIKAGAALIEPTSGNTGIGLAAVGVHRGYKVIVVMPDNMSLERQKLMRAYGAEVILTPAAGGMSASIAKAKEIAANTPNSFIPSQFDNPANAEAHYLSTGREIWNDTDGEVDIFVAGVGTGGTLTGSARYLKEMKPEIKVVAVEPDTSAVLSGKPAGAHGLSGIGAGFIPEVLDVSLIDEIMPISVDEAKAACRNLASREGVLVGISSGAALAAALKLAKLEENKGKNIAVILPDGGERYLSTDLFG
jgi:cysteine synthase A